MGSNLADSIENLWNSNHPFVAFRYPSKKKIHLYYQKENSILKTTNFKESGFVFAPFLNEDSTIYIPDTYHKKIAYNPSNDKLFSINKGFEANNKKEFIASVEKAINEIHSKNIYKVVLSRQQKIKGKNAIPIKTFENLLSLYNNAFVYLWHHPKVGTWLGATPEQLFSLKHNKMQTVALAGTISTQDKFNWSNKEKKEQNIVTEYITDNLKQKFKNSKIKEGALKTIKVGNIAHLKTKITAVDTDFTVKYLIKVLHPTPAVCGVPKDKAHSFISKQEASKREYYTGFLGVVKNSTKAKLFVNIRCTSFANNNEYTLYGGAGITAESNPLMEYEETQNKILAISRCLE